MKCDLDRDLALAEIGRLADSLHADIVRERRTVLLIPELLKRLPAHHPARDFLQAVVELKDQTEALLLGVGVGQVRSWRPEAPSTEGGQGESA